MDRITRTLIFGQDTREKIVRGVEIAAKAVGTTLGSRGRNVALEKNWGAPIILHDGVSVAREVILKDPYENMGAQLVIAAAQKTNDQAGDGTTTATILTYAIVKEAMKIVSAGNNPMIIRKGIEKAVAAVLSEMSRSAKKITKSEDLKNVATISCADAEIGELIADAIQKVGEEGIVTVQEGQKSYIEVEYKEGMDFDRGLLSPYFITDQSRFEAVLNSTKSEKNVYVIVVDEVMKQTDIVSLLSKVYKGTDRPTVLFIANDYEPDALSVLVINRIRQGMPIFAVRSPEYGEHRTNLLNDIATITGGHLITNKGTGIPLEQATKESFGRTEKVIITKDQTLIINGAGKESDIKERIQSIDMLLSEVKMEGERDKLQSRKAKLTGGVAVILVGAPSETEMREKKERIYDAVNATKAAIDEGIVPGGGVSLINARQIIKSLTIPDNEMRGAVIIYEALAYPIRKLIDNVGGIDPGYVIGKIEENKSKTYGYNVDSESFENLMETGIIDPVKVTKFALINAASVATMLITTDCMIAFEREYKKNDTVDNDGIGNFE